MKIANTSITSVSPVLRLMLIVANRENVSFWEAGRMIGPYTERGPDGLQKIRDDIDIPDWLFEAMREVLG